MSKDAIVSDTNELSELLNLFNLEVRLYLIVFTNISKHPRLLLETGIYINCIIVKCLRLKPNYECRTQEVVCTQTVRVDTTNT